MIFVGCPAMMVSRSLSKRGRQSMTNSKRKNAGRDILDLDEFLPHRFAALAQSLSREIEERQRKRHKLPMKDWKVMQALALHGELMPSDIHRLGVQNKAQISRALKCLLDRGLVAKRPHPDDNRTFSVSMTEEGWAIYEAIVPQMRQRQDEIIGHMPKDEVDELRRLLARLEDALRETKVAEP